MSNSADELGQGGSAKRPAAVPDRRTTGIKNWPLVRKVEAIIFFAMFLAVPLFAVRVVHYTQEQLIVRNVYRELVKDLGRAKSMAIESRESVEVTGEASKKARVFSYSIKHVSADGKPIEPEPSAITEEVVLPENVTVVGTVTFTASGKPLEPSSFIVSSNNRTSTVEIDREGIVSVP